MIVAICSRYGNDILSSHSRKEDFCSSVSIYQIDISVNPTDINVNQISALHKQLAMISITFYLITCQSLQEFRMAYQIL